MLFKTNSTSGKVIRGYSNSEFGKLNLSQLTNIYIDHAAMILKFGETPSDVFIIEATGDQGVSIKNF